MANAAWVGDLTKKQEALRVHHGLQARKDGWYKSIDGKRRYVATRQPLEDVVKILDARVAEIRGDKVERSSKLSVSVTTIEELAEMYLAHLWQRYKHGSPRKLSRKTYDDYLSVLGRFVEAVGPRQPAIDANPTWFSRFMRTIGDKAATTKRREIIYLTAFFNWAGPGRHSLNYYKDHVQFGPDFRKPDEAKLRIGLAASSTLYTPLELGAALDAVWPCPMLYAMGLLAFNCAFIPEDLSTIPLESIDLDAGIHEFPRGKTGIPRKAVLMPQTIEAIERYLRVRPNIGADAPLFLRDDGRPFNARDEDSADAPAGRGNTLARYWSWITGKTLKGLRTTFATLADDAIDQRAVDLIMGHKSDSIRAKHYVKQFEPARLRGVIELAWQRGVPQGPRPAAASIGPFALARLVGARSDSSSTPQPPPERSDIAAA